MPKTFSDRERKYISERLMEETQKCLALYGIRKTTVDELVKRVGIPKGTFYLFYESKERLIFDVILQFHDTIQRKIVAAVSSLKDDMDYEKLTEIIFGLYKKLGDSFIPKLIADGELELFMRKLPVEFSQLHMEKDDFQFEELVASIPNIEVENIHVFSAAFRGVFLSLLYKQELGEEVFDEAIRIMIRGVVIQLFEGDKK